MERVLYCPEVSTNLLSVRKLQEAGMTTIFEPNGSITIKGNDRIIMTGKSIKSLPNLKLNMHSNTAKTFAYICNVKKDYNLSHKILGHISTSKFIELKNKDMFFDTKLIN